MSAIPSFSEDILLIASAFIDGIMSSLLPLLWAILSGRILIEEF